MAEVVARIGLDCKLYRNAGSYETPEWIEIDHVKNVTTNLGGADADVSTRGTGGFRANKKTLKEISLDFDLESVVADENFSVLQAAYFNDTNIEFLVLDGDVETAGSSGVRFTGQVFQFNRSEGLEDPVMAAVNVKPTLAANDPEFYEVTT